MSYMKSAISLFAFVALESSMFASTAPVNGEIGDLPTIFDSEATYERCLQVIDHYNQVTIPFLCGGVEHFANPIPDTWCSDRSHGGWGGGEYVITCI